MNDRTQNHYFCCLLNRSLLCLLEICCFAIYCQVQPEIAAADDEHSEFSAGSPLPFSKWGEGSQFHLSQKTLFSVHNVYFENWQLQYKHFSAHFYQFLGPGGPKMAKNKQIPEIWCAQWHLSDWTEPLPAKLGLSKPSNIKNGPKIKNWSPPSKNQIVVCPFSRTRNPYRF